MNPIGGYFELELNRGSFRYHETPLLTKSGRSSLLYILGITKPTLVYVPYYTCNSLLEPFRAANIKYVFYEINDSLEPRLLPILNAGEYFVYINYFDLKRGTVALLSEKYKDRLIVDCTQAFFMKGNGVSWYFNSCRKFFGVPDGSYMYAPQGIQIPELETRNEAFITGHLITRFNGHANDGYEYFIENEDLAGKGLFRISKLSEYLLSCINYKDVAQRRRANFNYLYNRYQPINELTLQPQIDSLPMNFPLALNRKLNKTPLFARNIFIPTFWNDTHSRNINGFEFEKNFSDRLWPLPIDHRYSIEDMELLCNSLAGVLE